MFVRGAEESYPDIEYRIRAGENPAIAAFDGVIEYKYQFVEIFCQAFTTHFWRTAKLLHSARSSRPAHFNGYE